MSDGDAIEPGGDLMPGGEEVPLNIICDGLFSNILHAGSYVANDEILENALIRDIGDEEINNTCAKVYKRFPLPKPSTHRLKKLKIKELIAHTRTLNNDGKLGAALAAREISGPHVGNVVL